MPTHPSNSDIMAKLDDHGDVLTRLDERSVQHDKRISGVEKRSAFISFVTGLSAALGVNLAHFFGIKL